MKDKLKIVDGGVAAASGFLACGVTAGIKAKRPDVALLQSLHEAVTAGVFTTNKVQGSHVKLCKEHLASGTAKAVIMNAGNANACNGVKGDEDALQMAEVTAESLGIAVDDVLVCSTGTIGVPMPMEKVLKGIHSAVEELSETGGAAAAGAIMTTDTIDKQFAVELEIDNKVVRVGGMAKGAGMIEPNMATMLAFVTTDASVDSEAVKDCLTSAVEKSFNRISVDGDQSCNDTVLLMANGVAGNSPLNQDHPAWALFCSAVDRVCKELAMEIVKDGEGATKFVTVTVKGACTTDDARCAARAVANSLLVKTSWYGGDPNWGRAIDAVGYSGAEMVPQDVDISYDDVQAVKEGQASGQPLKDLEAVLAKDSFSVIIDLNIGDETDTVYTCDCSEAYVRINSEYMT
jgi:glutamate N-acetyltransferase/amino-acid N-acetyltransferase